MPRKKKNNMYFTEDTERAIVEYNNTDNQIQRNIIYNKDIKKPLEKLAEYVINTFKFPYINDSLKNKKHEVVVHLMFNLNKFSPNKGKAFSYFSVAAKRYLIINNDIAYSKTKREYSINTEFDNNEFGTHNMLEIVDKTPQNDELKSENKEFISYLIKNIDKHVDILFKHQRDKKIIYALLQLMENYENIENFNKKSLYILLRDMTGVKAHNITHALNIIFKLYKELKYIYDEYGEIPDSYIFNVNEIGKKYFK